MALFIATWSLDLSAWIASKDTAKLSSGHIRPLAYRKGIPDALQIMYNNSSAMCVTPMGGSSRNNYLCAETHRTIKVGCTYFGIDVVIRAFRQFSAKKIIFSQKLM
jgi:hypothetical protein